MSSRVCIWNNNGTSSSSVYLVRRALIGIMIISRQHNNPSEWIVFMIRQTETAVGNVPHKRKFNTSTHHHILLIQTLLISQNTSLMPATLDQAVLRASSLTEYLLLRWLFHFAILNKQLNYQPPSLRHVAKQCVPWRFINIYKSMIRLMLKEGIL